MVFPPTSVRHLGASRVSGSSRDPVPAANKSAVLIVVSSTSSDVCFIYMISRSI